MDPDLLLETVRSFLQRHALAVQASVFPTGEPQAAVVGIVVSDELEVFFDTLATSRKLENLRSRPEIALVVGWDDQQTVQLEGLADEPAGADLERLKELYFERFPDGRERESWPLIAYLRVQPNWIRYSDFRGETPQVHELTRPYLGASF